MNEILQSVGISHVQEVYADDNGKKTNNAVMYRYVREQVDETKV